MSDDLPGLLEYLRSKHEAMQVSQRGQQLTNNGAYYLTSVDDLGALLELGEFIQHKPECNALVVLPGIVPAGFRVAGTCDCGLDALTKALLNPDKKKPLAT